MGRREQANRESASPDAKTRDALIAELYERECKGWETFRRKDAAAYAEGYAEDAIGFDISGAGLKDKAAAVADIYAAELKHYDMTGFRAEEIAPGVALVHYYASMSGTANGEPFEVRMFIGQVLVKQGERWLLRYFQNTAVR